MPLAIRNVPIRGLASPAQSLQGEASEGGRSPPPSYLAHMGEVLDLAERFWRGEIPRRDLWRPTGKHEELVPGLVFFHTWANVTALRTEAGLVLVDTGNFATRDRTFAAVRAVDPAPLAAAVYTHGHVDHACGLPPFLAEAREKGRPEPVIVAHRNVPARFDRYRMTAPWNGLINSRQFSVAATWPTSTSTPGPSTTPRTLSRLAESGSSSRM